LLDELTLDELPDREMCVQSMTGLMPLRNTDISKRLATCRSAKSAEEFTQVSANHVRVMATTTGIGQRAEPIQPVGGAIPSEATAGAAARFR
jgi:hypothetical protein